MKRIQAVFLVVAQFIAGHAAAQQPNSSAMSANTQKYPCTESVPYGDNTEAGRFVTVNGIKLYYETYGNGPVLLLLHGNGGSIVRMACQIAFFSSSYKVVAVDSRGRGKSEDGSGPFTFEQQADDFSELLEQEKLGKADVLGSSDGGIIALMMGIRHPDKMGKIVASAPNLTPDDTALTASVIADMKDKVAEAGAKLAAGDTSRNWDRRKRQIEQDLYGPHISLEQVNSIKSPTLIVGADDDVIHPEHFLEIYNNLTDGYLFIVPGTDHSGLLTSAMFNPTVSRFLDGSIARSKRQ